MSKPEFGALRLSSITLLCLFFAWPTATSSRLVAQDRRAPSAFAITDDARPISTSERSVAASSASARWSTVKKHRVGSSAALRWREPAIRGAVQPASVTRFPGESSAQSAAPATLTWGTDETHPRRSPVRLVNQLGPIDPFDDPFGDRARQAEPRPTRPSTPTGIQPVPDAEEAPPEPTLPPAFSDPVPNEFPEPPVEPEVPQPIQPEAEPEMTPFEDDAAPALPDHLVPRVPQAQPAPLPPLQPTKPCDRIYNRRNCCEEGEQCQHFRKRVRENTIQNISLDISPSFKPDALSASEVEQARAIKLAESEVRSWRNRRGEVVARGQVVDLQFGQVHVESDGDVTKIPVRQLSDDDWCFLAAWWGVPTECSLGDLKFEHREWLASTMTWKASALCHKPLYFEEVQLERYGHSAGPFLQPALSGAHFFLNIATMPYKMGINPPNECRYALGYYRPGDCAPWLLPPPPLSVRGGLMQAGAIVGGIYVIP